MPDWYPVLEAAKWLGVAPWELMEREQYWIDWALMHRSAVRSTETK